MAACGTKKTFVTTWEADAALKAIRRKPRPDENGSTPIRSYQCPSCSFYHLTHYAEGESNYEKAVASVRVAQQKAVVGVRPVDLPSSAPILDAPAPRKRGGWTWSPEAKARAAERAQARGPRGPMSDEAKENMRLAAQKHWAKPESHEACRERQNRPEVVAKKRENAKRQWDEGRAFAERTSDTRDRQALARLFLERLPMLTQEERQAVVGILG